MGDIARIRWYPLYFFILLCMTTTLSNAAPSIASRYSPNTPRYLSSSRRGALPKSFGYFSYARHPAQLGHFDPLLGVRDVILHQGLPEVLESKGSDTQCATTGRQYTDRVLWMHERHPDFESLERRQEEGEGDAGVKAESQDGAEREEGQEGQDIDVQSAIGEEEPGPAGEEEVEEPDVSSASAIAADTRPVDLSEVGADQAITEESSEQTQGENAADTQSQSWTDAQSVDVGVEVTQDQPDTTTDVDVNANADSDEWYWTEDDGSDPEQVDCSQIQGPQLPRRDGIEEQGLDTQMEKRRKDKEHKKSKNNDDDDDDYEDEDHGYDRYDDDKYDDRKHNKYDDGQWHHWDDESNSREEGKHAKTSGGGRYADDTDDGYGPSHGGQYGSQSKGKYNDDDKSYDSDNGAYGDPKPSKGDQTGGSIGENANAYNEDPDADDWGSSRNRHSNAGSGNKHPITSSAYHPDLPVHKSSSPKNTYAGGGAHRLAQSAYGTASQSDCSRLMQFYRGMGGDQWVRTAGWDDMDNLDCCTWYGVTCRLPAPVRKSWKDEGAKDEDEWDNSDSGGYSAKKSAGGWKDTDESEGGEQGGDDEPESKWNIPSTAKNDKRVIAVDLSGNGLKGALSNYIFALDALERLDISNNDLKSLPDRFNTLRHLTHLKASNNTLTGLVPPTLLSSQSLISLNLANNELSGDVHLATPSLLSLSMQHNRLDSITLSPDMISLNKVYVSDNAFKGSLPDLSGSAGLSVFDVSNNSTGPLFDLTRLSNLTYFDVRQNQLTGPVPATLQPNVKLITFHISSNNLIGPFPIEPAPRSLIRCSVSPNPIQPCPPPSELDDKLSLGSVCHLSCANAQGVAGAGASAARPQSLGLAKGPGIPVSPLPGEAAVPLAQNEPLQQQGGLVAPMGLGEYPQQSIPAGTMVGAGARTIIGEAAAIRQTRVGGASRRRHSRLGGQLFSTISLACIFWLFTTT